MLSDRLSMGKVGLAFSLSRFEGDNDWGQDTGNVISRVARSESENNES
jgi:hypothetical protein